MVREEGEHGETVPVVEREVPSADRILGGEGQASTGTCCMPGRQTRGSCGVAVRLSWRTERPADSDAHTCSCRTGSEIDRFTQVPTCLPAYLHPSRHGLFLMSVVSLPRILAPRAQDSGRFCLFLHDFRGAPVRKTVYKPASSVLQRSPPLCRPKLAATIPVLAATLLLPTCCCHCLAVSTRAVVRLPNG